jgi:simple sugar transport system ATP-binding protein
MNTPPTPIVALTNVTKRYGHVEVLKGVTCKMYKGQITALVGDNGAGKSTLIKIICGVHQADTGEVIFDGSPTRWKSPEEARRNGIETVYQDLALVDSMSIARNFFLAKEPLKNKLLGILDREKMGRDALEAIRTLGISLNDPNKLVSDLSGGERKSIAIARSLYFKPKLLILDEPTAALSIRESRIVLEHVQAVKNMGISVIFIGHNIHHVYPIADRCIILDRGQIIGDVEKTQVTVDDVINAIVTGQKLTSH